jgi:hypothetical protein
MASVAAAEIVTSVAKVTEVESGANHTYGKAGPFPLTKARTTAMKGEEASQRENAEDTRDQEQRRSVEVWSPDLVAEPLIELVGIAGLADCLATGQTPSAAPSPHRHLVVNEPSDPRATGVKVSDSSRHARRPWWSRPYPRKSGVRHFLGGIRVAISYLITSER